MKVGELIYLLQEWNPDDEVAIQIDRYMYSPSFETEKREVTGLCGEDYSAVTIYIDCQVGVAGKFVGE